MVALEIEKYEAGVAKQRQGMGYGFQGQGQYDRLRLEHDALTLFCFYDNGRKLGFLHRLLEP